MNIRPLFDNVVIDTEDKKETTKSGFILPSSASEKYKTAKVKAVGLGGQMYGKEVTMYVKAGDTVLFPADSETKIKVNGEEVVFIRQSDVLAVID